MIRVSAGSEELIRGESKYGEAPLGMPAFAELKRTRR
jgi:hypothetical protein